MGFDCCTTTAADEWKALSAARPCLIPWTCPVCESTIPPGRGACHRAACLATGRPPTRQDCLVKLFKRIEELTSVMDHIPDRPAVQSDFYPSTPAQTMAHILMPHGRQGQGLMRGMWAKPTETCGCSSNEELIVELGEATHTRAV